MPKYGGFLYGASDYSAPLARIWINGTERTDDVPLASVRVEQTVSNRVISASFTVLDGSTFGLAEHQEVLITAADQNTRYFNGQIHSFTETEIAGVMDYAVECVDWSWDLEHPEDLHDDTHAAENDSAIIATAMATCCPDIEASTYVETVYGSVTNLEFKHVTAREVLDKLAEMAGAYWYVDFGPGPDPQKAYLHYFDAATNNAPFDLSDSPDNVSTFGFEELKEVQGPCEANRVVVIGGGDIEVVRTSGAEGDYGRWITGKLVDSDIRTEAQANTYGDNWLAEKAANPTWQCIVRKAGLMVGQTINLTDSSRGLNENVEIQRLTMKLIGAGQAEWEVEMGKFIPRLPDLIAEASRGGGGGGKKQEEEEIEWEDFEDDDYLPHVHTYDKTDTPTASGGSSHTHGFSGTTAGGSSHSHTLSGNTGTESTHSHGVSGDTGGGSSHSHSVNVHGSTTSSDCHDHSGTTSSNGDPAHTHTITVGGYTHDHSYTEVSTPTGSENIHAHAFATITTSDGGHSHSLSSGGVSGESGHTHGYSGTTASGGGSHTHSLTYTETNTSTRVIP